MPRSLLPRFPRTLPAGPLPIELYRYWNACNTPVFGPEGRVDYILHSVEEVTEKVLSEKKAERAMRGLQLTRQRQGSAGERRLRQAQRAGRVGSFEWLLKENRAFCTPELEELYGLPEGAFQPSGFDGWRQWVFPEDADRVVAELKGCMAQHLPDCVYEFRAVLPDGTLRWLRGQAQLFYDETGAPERMIGINIDIDAQKQAEEHLRDSEERLRAIYDGTYEYIGLLAPDGMLLEANRASLEFGGSKREDVVGRPFWETVWFAGTPGAPERVRQAIARAASAAAPVTYQLRDPISKGARVAGRLKVTKPNLRGAKRRSNSSNALKTRRDGLRRQGSRQMAGSGWRGLSVPRQAVAARYKFDTIKDGQHRTQKTRAPHPPHQRRHR